MLQIGVVFVGESSVGAEGGVLAALGAVAVLGAVDGRAHVGPGAVEPGRAQAAELLTLVLLVISGVAGDGESRALGTAVTRGAVEFGRSGRVDGLVTRAVVPGGTQARRSTQA